MSRGKRLPPKISEERAKAIRAVYREASDGPGLPVVLAHPDITEPAFPPAPEPPRQPLEPTSKYARLTLSEKARIVLLREEGLTQTAIAEDVGCALSTVHDTLAQVKDKEDVIRMLVLGKFEDRIANWDEAEKVASKRGDHRPTKERIEMAMPKLRPQPALNAGHGGGVVINIGQPGQPIELPVIEIAAKPE